MQAAKLLNGSGPTFAGGERSEPPCKSAGRGPGETVALDKLTVESESVSALPKLRAVGRAAMPAPRQPGPWPARCRPPGVGRGWQGKGRDRGPWSRAVPP